MVFSGTFRAPVLALSKIQAIVWFAHQERTTNVGLPKWLQITNKGSSRADSCLAEWGRASCCMFSSLLGGYLLLLLILLVLALLILLELFFIGLLLDA